MDEKRPHLPCIGAQGSCLAAPIHPRHFWRTTRGSSGMSPASLLAALIWVCTLPLWSPYTLPHSPHSRVLWDEPRQLGRVAFDGGRLRQGLAVNLHVEEGGEGGVRRWDWERLCQGLAINLNARAVTQKAMR